MQYNHEELDKSLAILNQYLYDGFLIKTKFLKKHDIDGQKVAVDVDDLKKEYKDEINNWLRIVGSYIFNNLERHLYFHFNNPKPDAFQYNHPLGKFTYALEKSLYALEDIIVRLEERRNLAIRQEIADKEYQTDILYEVTYSTHLREIKLNNIVLANLQSDSKNVNFFEYVFLHPNTPLAVSEIEDTTAMKLSANIQDILRDLGFKGNIRKVFFPIATKSKVMFVNPITKQYQIKNDLPVIKLSKDNETERDSAS